MILDGALLKKVVSTLLSSGGQYADLYYQDMTARMVEAESGRIERISTTREKGVGLRLIRQGVTHFATTVDMAPNSLIELASALASGAGPVAKARKVRLERTPGGFH
jgi:TldD protein